MKKLTALFLVAFMVMAIFAPMAFASEGKTDAQLNYYAMAVIGCGLGIGLAALGTGIGMGTAVSRACEGVARNPGVNNKIMTMLIVGLAMIESLAIYALVVDIIVLFVNPFGI